MDYLVSICIPTCKRPRLLLEAVNSCLEQSYKHIEIIISDDSPDNNSEQLISQLGKTDMIRYYRNSVPLGQAGNVNQLFSLAVGKYLVLLHDDDLLLPNAVKDLLQVLQAEPEIVACFGKQYVVNMQSEILEKESIELNTAHYRSSEYSGLQSSTIVSALRGQFPNNAYMILTKAAQQIRYSDSPLVGDACDYDFGLRVASKFQKVYFLDRYVSSYRWTDVSIARNSNCTNLTYDLIANFSVPKELECFRAVKLRQYAGPAINRWLGLGVKQRAIKIYFSEYYSWGQRLSKRGLVQAVLLVFPSFFLKLILNKLIANSRSQV